MTRQNHNQFSYLMKMLRLHSGRVSDLNQMRRDLDAFGAIFPMADSISVEPVNISGCSFEWLIPENEVKNCTLIYLHGGGFVMGSVRSHRQLASRIAASSKMRTLVLAYRLAPEHPFPAALDDVYTVYKFLSTNGYSSHKIGLVGDSAGGGLCIAAMIMLKQKGIFLPGACVCLSPWVDLTLNGESWTFNEDFDDLVRRNKAEWMVQAYLSGRNPYDSLSSPVYADFSGLPAMLIHVGSREVLLSDAKALYKRARYCGVPAELQIWEDMPHVWHYMAHVLEEGQTAIDQAADFLVRHLTGR